MEIYSLSAFPNWVSSRELRPTEKDSSECFLNSPKKMYLASTVLDAEETS